jgi:hypothetical protein
MYNNYIQNQTVYNASPHTTYKKLSTILVLIQAAKRSLKCLTQHSRSDVLAAPLPQASAASPISPPACT